MTTLDALLNWVQGREQLLSGLAALVVLIGVIVSPLGHGLRMLVARRRGAQPGHGPQAGAAHPAVVMDRPSIAVLPFDNLSDDRDLAFTADGMSEDIITELSRDRRLFVIARNSSFAYKDKRPNVRDVGRELGVHFVLEGSVRRVGESLRVNAQLIDAQSGAHVWAETLNGNFADAAKALDEIGHSIATALTSHFFREDAAGAAKTESLQAWEFLARSAVKWATSGAHSRSGAGEISRFGPSLGADGSWPRVRLALRSRCEFHRNQPVCAQLHRACARTGAQ